MKQHEDSGIAYLSTVIDKLGPPPVFFSEERYLGYRESDLAKPYAHFFRSTPQPMQPHVAQALRAGPTLAANVIPIADVARRMSEKGHLALETGYGMGADGTACVACLTDMPGVEPLMWHWWFGWHIAESARYKLWHPSAHVFSAPGRANIEGSSSSNEGCYIGNVSYIDEYIGERLMRLAVRFTSPSILGFAAASADSVTIVGRGGPSFAPITAVWLIHQIRRTSTGSEMRSRFYIGPPIPLPGAADLRSAADGPVQAEPSPINLLEHCGVEMNHLASFLPSLYHEFSGDRHSAIRDK